MRGIATRLLLAAAALGTLATASPAAAQGPALPAMRVFAAPTPLPATDDRRHLVYEIFVVNETRFRVTLNRLEVRSGNARRLLASYFGNAITERMLGADGTPTRTLGRGDLGVILLNVKLAPGRGAPERLVHRVGLKLERTGTPTRRRVVLRARTRVSRRAPLVLAPPLRGVDIAAVGCCDPPFAHRLAFLERAGRPVNSQRYAIDFVRVNTDNVTFAGDPTQNANYFIYGDEVLAAAPGRIAATRDGVPENAPPGEPANPTEESAAGNFVTEELAGGRYALYAHLQPGSLRVRPGDTVQTGQVLGLVGNTGNSDQPHLHFHVMDGPGDASQLRAEGVPYTFDRLALLARLTGEAPPLVRHDVTPPLELSGRYPLQGDLLAFP